MQSQHVDLRFYGALRDFLSFGASSGLVTRTFDVPGSVKDMIEACGVPHTEIALVLANGESVDYRYRVADGDRIAVYPPFKSIDVSSVALVAPEALDEPRFVLDVHLGRLARYLRLLGFDSLHNDSWTDPDLVQIAAADRRVLLTRDIDVLMHGSLTHGYFVRSTDPAEQLEEVAARFELGEDMTPFSRCMACNGSLAPVAKQDVASELPPRTRDAYHDFTRCRSCRRVYWPGAHYGSLVEIVEGIANR